MDFNDYDDMGDSRPHDASDDEPCPRCAFLAQVRESGAFDRLLEKAAEHGISTAENFVEFAVVLADRRSGFVRRVTKRMLQDAVKVRFGDSDRKPKQCPVVALVRRERVDEVLADTASEAVQHVWRNVQGDRTLLPILVYLRGGFTIIRSSRPLN